MLTKILTFKKTIIIFLLLLFKENFYFLELQPLVILDKASVSIYFSVTKSPFTKCFGAPFTINVIS